jgi:S-adenosylmethionine-diacylglycerol 3-amino-3-carboxypropyl transferase
MMCLLGVPKAQQDLLKKKFRKGAYEFITAKLRSVFYRIPLKENYFWRVYLEGRYSKECCPNYLKKEHFEAIRAARHKLRTYSTTLSSFLTKNPGKYTHFVLLDHQDWLANQFPEALHEEWQLILKNSVYGTRILMRSAAENINFIPEFVRNNVRFDEKKAADNHQIDRVGTYASVHLAVIN